MIPYEKFADNCARLQERVAKAAESCGRELRQSQGLTHILLPLHRGPTCLSLPAIVPGFGMGRKALA